jgi:DNA-binding CsgD family transcriptional regulator
VIDDAATTLSPTPQAVRERSRRRLDFAAAAVRGRDRELDVIGECLAATARGQGGVLLVEGAPGIGKSRVLAEAREMARRTGVRAMFAEAFESQQTVPFAALLTATLAGGSPIGDIESMRRQGRRPELLYWMLHELQGALESAALRGPLALMFDDLQWADTGTLVALRTLPARLSGTPILWVLAARSRHGRPPLSQAMARLERDGARRLSVGPLSPDAVAEVLSDALRAPADPALLRLAANTHGSPFLLVELLHGLWEEDRLHVEAGRATVAGDALPRRLTDSMRERLELLSDDAQLAVRVATVLGERFSAQQLAAMLRRRPSTLVGVLQEALAADLLVEVDEQLRFRHDLLRQAVLETLPRSLRRALQREAATVLLQGGAAPVEVAMQLAASAEVGDRQAIAALRQAAREWAGSDAQAAADLSVRALELMPPHDEGRGALVAETVILLHTAMRPQDAHALGESTLARVLSRAQEAEVRLSLSSMFMRSTVARAQDNRRALRLPDLAPEMRARHLAWLAYNLATTGLVDEAIEAAQPALAAARETDDLQARVMATLAVACADGTRGAWTQALASIEGLLQATPRVRTEPYLHAIDFHHADALFNLGRVQDAMALLAQGVARGQREHNGWLLEWWAQFGSFLRLAAGRLGDARAEAESSEIPVEQFEDGHVAPGLLTLAEVAVHTGDAALLKASEETARRLYVANSPELRRHGAWILALIAMAADEPDAAARWLRDDARPYAVPCFTNDPGRHPVVARIAVAAGDGELARRTVEVTAALRRENPDAPILDAIAAHARGLVDGDPAVLLPAARLLRETERPLLYAAAAEDAGRALVAAGRVDEGIAESNEAFDTYLELEAGADARRVGRLLRDHGVRRRVPFNERPVSGWASLTDSELRVARLVGSGATNRSAAQQLFLSPHTVSSHLRRTFTKLGINSRVELARIMVDADGAAGVGPSQAPNGDA